MDLSLLSVDSTVFGVFGVERCTLIVHHWSLYPSYSRLKMYEAIIVDIFVLFRVYEAIIVDIFVDVRWKKRVLLRTKR